MRTLLARLVAALAVLALIAAGCGDDDETTTTAAADTAADAHDHDHGSALEVPDAMAVPEITIEVLPDPKSGQNLFIDLANFELAPRNASTDPVNGQGHLHLYVDGEKQARFYNDALHLNLEPGTHEVMVEVSANDHSAYAVDGTPIRAMASIDVPDPEDAGHMHHEPIEVAAEAAPTVDIEVEADPKSGWNLFIDLANFELAPRRASTEPVDGQGHMHLYIDGDKIGRLYGTAWHIAALAPGDHVIEVEVSANNHSPYAVDGELIRAAATLTVAADDAGAMAMDDSHDGDDHEHGSGSDFDAAITAENADVVIDVAVADGEVEVADGRVAVDRDQTVAVVVTSDATDELHLHGYDYLADLGAGETATFGFIADIPGVFELELERSGLLVVELQVG